jgi:hypothetical protein
MVLPYWSSGDGISLEWQDGGFLGSQALAAHLQHWVPVAMHALVMDPEMFSPTWNQNSLSARVGAVQIRHFRWMPPTPTFEQSSSSAHLPRKWELLAWIAMLRRRQQRRGKHSKRGSSGRPEQLPSRHSN